MSFGLCFNNECCGCLAFRDHFASRTPVNISEDGVNFIDAHRYDFTEGDWHVDTTGTHRLVCDTPDSPITFATGARSIQVEVYGLDEDQYVTISNGTNSITVTADGTNDRINVDLDGKTDYQLMAVPPPYDLSGSAGSLRLYLVDRDDEKEYTPGGNPSFAEIASVLSVDGTASDYLYGYPGCVFAPVDIDAESPSWEWSITCSAGIEFDSLSVYQAHNDDGSGGPCVYADYGCAHICGVDILPTSVSVTIDGLSDTEMACYPEDDEGCQTDCDDDYDACILAAMTAAARCACEAAVRDCRCACNNSLAEVKTKCPGEAFNSTFVLDRKTDGFEGSRCAGIDECYFEGTFDFGPLNCEDDAAPLTFSAYLNIDYYDSTAEILYTHLELFLPFGNAAQECSSIWSIGDVPASEVCEGNEFALTATTTMYADTICVAGYCGHEELEPQNKWLRGCPNEFDHDDTFTTTTGAGDSLTFPTGGAAGYEIGSIIHLEWFDPVLGMQGADVEITNITGDTVEYDLSSGDPLPPDGTDVEVSGTVDCFPSPPDPQAPGCTVCPAQAYPPHDQITDVTIDTAA